MRSNLLVLVLSGQVVEELEHAGVQHVVPVGVRDEDVHYGLQQSLLDEVHCEHVVLGLDHSLEELYYPQVQRLRPQPREPAYLLDYLRLQREDAEAEAVLLHTLGQDLNNEPPCAL